MSKSIQFAKIGKFCRIFANMNIRVSKIHLRTLGLTIFCLFCTFPLFANKIKVLSPDASVRTAVMPNGLSCYVVTSPTQKGRADFALVQNTGSKTVADAGYGRLVDLSREALASQRRLLHPSVQDFFTYHGASAGKDGFVKVTDDATIYHFRNVDISTHADVLDSTLLVLMGIVDRVTTSQDTLVTGWFAPSDQAVVVCGDVDAGKVIDRIRGYSYMVPRYESRPRRDYVWKGSDSLSVNVEDGCSPLSVFNAVWRLPRTPRKNMHTVQPLVVEMYMTELSLLSEKRIRSALMLADIPYASVRCSYVQPADYLDDDTFSVEVQVAREDAARAVMISASALSSIASGHISEIQQTDVKNIFFDGRLLYERTFSNARHVRRCASAFLYNESLASEKSKNDFLMTRFIPDSTELRILKSIASATLSPEKNLSLTLVSDDARMTEDKLVSAFREGWESPWATPDKTSDPAFVISGQEELGEQREVPRVKVRSSGKEYISNGTLYTLSNGLKVVVKPTSEKDAIHWTLALNGGFGHIPDLEAGEAAYVSEFLDMCLLGGVKAESFWAGIRRIGITMDVDVRHSVTRFSGKIPDDGLADLMRLLLTVSETFTPDMEAVKYRMKCEPLVLTAAAGSLEDRIAVIDSVMCPDYRYTTRKSGFDMDFVGRAERFYEELFSKMDDGVLILMGDIDEKLLKQTLTKYAGAFLVYGRKSPRPVVSYQPISGAVMLEREGERNEVDMVMSAPISLTAENTYVAEMTSMCLANNVSKIVTGRGMHVRIRHQCSFYPQERVSMMLSLREASVDGFAPGTSHHEPMEALAAVRGLLRDMSSVELTEAELASYKAYLKQKMKRRLTEPEYLQDAISMRYIDGKDFVSGFEAKIDAVTVGDIRNMLGLLSNGGRVEYVIRRHENDLKSE